MVAKEGKEKKAAAVAKGKTSNAADVSTAPVVAASSSSSYAAMSDMSTITDVTSMRSALAQALQGFLPMVTNMSCIYDISHTVMLLTCRISCSVF